MFIGFRRALASTVLMPGMNGMRVSHTIFDTPYPRSRSQVQYPLGSILLRTETQLVIEGERHNMVLQV
jgi:hypothetical protein